MEEGWLESYEQWRDKEKPQREGQRLKQEAQLMLTTGATRLAVSRGQQP